MNELLGSRIKVLRRAKNLTQEQVADYIGISRQKYARIESGVNGVTLDILSKAAEVLGVTVGDITRVINESPVVQSCLRYFSAILFHGFYMYEDRLMSQFGNVKFFV